MKQVKEIEVGDTYKDGNSIVTVIKVDHTEAATWITVETDKGKTMTYGLKAFNTKFTKE